MQKPTWLDLFQTLLEQGVPLDSAYDRAEAAHLLDLECANVDNTIDSEPFINLRRAKVANREAC